MKRIIFILALLPILSGCFRDKGNYDYGVAEVITITGIESSYTVEQKVDKLAINPQVESNKPAEWEYRWEYYDAEEVIVVQEGRELSHVFDMDARSWTLLFVAKNTLTGVEKIVPIILNVVTPYSRGWYVLKDDGTNSDLDLFPSYAGYEPNGVRECVLANVNGAGMNGVGLKFQLSDSFSLLNDAGNFARTKVFMITTQNDIGVYRVTNLVRERDRVTISFEPWDKVSPGMCYTCMFGIYLVNSGKLHSITLVGSNSGRFGMYKQLGDDYYLSPYFALDDSGTIGFDELSSSFVNAGFYGDLTYCRKAAASEVDSQNNNLTCLYMGRCLSSAVGVFADKDTGERKILKLGLSTSANIKIVAALDEQDKINDASIMMVSNDDEFLYFVGNDGNVYSRAMNDAGTESLEFDVPDDETVTFIRQVRHLNSAMPLNCITVATVKGTGAQAAYTIRFFSKLGGHFDGENKEIRLTGNGYARDVNFVNPSVTSMNHYYNHLYL